jgi:CDP-glycerol glycerophosphotransferase (TagB/SpsB family)
LVYGKYAYDKISNYTNCIITGNPRYDKWHSDAFHRNCLEKYEHLLNKKKKTLLYLPTWGDLSSYNTYISKINKLSKKYNILIKLHHNTAIFNNKKIAKNNNIVYLSYRHDLIELLSICDIVLSDYSGAIYDAIYCKKPVVLLNIDESILRKSKKIDNFSLEYAKRELLGVVVENNKALEEKIEYAINNNQNLIKRVNHIRDKLFVNRNNTCEYVINILNGLEENKCIKTQIQQYIQKTEIKLLNKMYVKKFIKHIKRYYLKLNMYFTPLK